MKKINNNYIHDEWSVYDIKHMNLIARGDYLNSKIKADPNSIWMYATKIISVNDNGEIIADGETIYGEKHAMLLTPPKNP